MVLKEKSFFRFFFSQISVRLEIITILLDTARTMEILLIFWFNQK